MPVKRAYLDSGLRRNDKYEIDTLHGLDDRRFIDLVYQLPSFGGVCEIAGWLAGYLDAIDEMPCLVPKAEPVFRIASCRLSKDLGIKDLLLAAVGDDCAQTVGVHSGADVLAMDLCPEIACCRGTGWQRCSTGDHAVVELPDDAVGELYLRHDVVGHALHLVRTPRSGQVPGAAGA